MKKNINYNPPKINNFGFTIESGNSNEYPSVYAKDVWDKAVANTNLAKAMLESGVAPTNSETGEAQYSQSEVNEELADRSASKIKDYVGHKIISGTVQETELLKVMMEEQELLNRFAEVTNPTGNPKAQGWYTRTGDGTGAIPYVYTLTTDENVVQNEHYYVPVAEGIHSQHDINEALAERFNNYRQYISETLAAELRRETINITLTVSSSGTLSDLNGATVTIRDIYSQVVLWTGTWQGQMLTAVLTEGYRYAIECQTIQNYATPSAQKYTVIYGNSRNVTAEYVHISDAVDIFYIDDGIDDPATKITDANGRYGDSYVEGAVSRWIHENSHRYLVKKIGAAYEMKVAICQLDDTDTTKFATDGGTAALDGTHGDVMTRWPEFWYHVSCIRAEIAAMGAKWEIRLAANRPGINITPEDLYIRKTDAEKEVAQSSSLNPHDDGWYEYNNGSYVLTSDTSVGSKNYYSPMQHWDSNSLLGTYEGYVSGTSLFSRSGVQSTGSVSQDNFKVYARNRGYDEITGDGYTIMRWEQHNIHGLLYYARYGHTDSQLKLGYGSSGTQKVTGLTNSLGMQDTVGQGGNGDGGSINNCGVENSHGNKTEFIDNVYVQYANTGNVFNIKELDGIQRQVVTMPGKSAHVWPTRMVLGDHFDLIPTPNNVVGDDSKGYCDGFYLVNSTPRVVGVSYNSSASSGGITYVSAGFVSSTPFTYVGARLAFHGEITEYDGTEITNGVVTNGVSDFLSLTLQ